MIWTILHKKKKGIPMEQNSRREKFIFLLALSISTAIFCGIWAALAPLVGLLSWAGFAGCTTYFSTGSHGWVGLRRTLLPNLAGLACGISCFYLGEFFPVLGTWGVWCAIITFIMCIVSYFKLLDFCPGIFMGCFSTFASLGGAADCGGIPMVFVYLGLSLIAGAFLGVLCDKGGVLLHKLFTRKSK